MIKILQNIFFLILIFFTYSIAGAQVWKKQAKSGNAGLKDIVFISKSTGFALSFDKVLKTTDTGKTWNQILTSYKKFYRITFADANNGYITGYDDLVLKTTDGGANWSLKSTGNSKHDLLAVFAKSKDTVFVAGSDIDSTNYIISSYNGGNSWSKKSLSSKQMITSMFMRNKNSGVMGTLKGGILETNNGFSSYNVNTNPGIQINDLRIIQDSIIILVGNGGKISRSIDYGKTYNSINSAISENLNSLHFSNDTFGMACGESGTILYTNNSGKSWTKMITNTQLYFTRVYVINPYLAWAVAYSSSGDSLDIFKFEDKSCLSRYVKVPSDTVICDKYDYETPFVTVGAYKPTWTIDDLQTSLNIKNDSIASITGTHEGYYIIAFELQSCEEILRDTARVYMWRNPSIYAKDSMYCGSVNDNISFSCFACSFLWSDSSDAYNLKVTQPGKYWVRVSNRCKTISDTFTLSYLPYLKLDLGRDTLLCNQEKLTIKNSLSPGKYLWNDLDTNSSKTISKAGMYYLDFKNKCNTLSDTIDVKYKRSPTLYLGRDSIYCTAINHSVSLDSVKNFSDVTWWDASTQYSKNFNLPGKYYATVSNECGKVSDTLQLGLLNIPEVSLGRDTIYCKNFTHVISINPKVSDYKILWGDGKDSIVRKFTNPGNYNVRVYNRCGEVKDTIIIDQKAIPFVYLGKDTSLKKPFSLTLDAKNSGSSYLWSTGSILQSITVNDFGKYWVRASNYCGMSIDTIWLKDKAGLKNIIKNSIKVYPNPVVEGNLVIENLGGDYELELFDQLGNKVSEISTSASRQTIDINHLDKGVYYLKIRNNELIVEVVRVLKI